MKSVRKILTSLICIAAVCFSGLAPVAGESEELKPEELKIEGKTAIIFCGDTDEVIWEKEADKKMEPASMTKLMTCLLAAENLEPDKVVEITEEAASMPPTNINLKTGEEITVEDLMYGLLLESGNDAAVALAIETAGSVDSFADMMNERAKEIGCTSTNFVNPSGLEDKNNYSTARDMALIAREALSNETVRKISGTSKYTIPKTNLYEERELENSNFFLTGIDEEKYGEKLEIDKYEGVFGGKTGYLGDERATMVTGVDAGGLEVYAVVMGSSLEGRYSDIEKLMDYGKANVSKYAVFEKGDEFGKVKLLGGAVNKVAAIAADDGYINLPEGVSASLVTTECIYTDNLTAPVKQGQKIGAVEIYIAGELKRTVDLVASEDIEEGWFLSGIGISNLQTILLGSFIAIVLIAFAVIISMRIKNKRKLARIRKRKLEEEAMRRMEREEDLKRRDWHF